MAQSRQKIVFRLSLGLVFWLLISCQSATQFVPAPSQSETQQLQRELQGVELLGEQLNVQDFLAVDENMQYFLDSYVRKRGTKSRRLNRLVKNLISKSAVNVEYDAGAHFSASGAFAHSRANCLSFSALVIALGRKVNLNLQFQEVDLPPSWSLGSADLLLQFRHVNVLAELDNGDRQVVDFRLERFSHFYPKRVISAEQALALHFNNLAVEAMLAKRWPEVFSNLKQALAADQQSSVAWSNLGLALKRRGKLSLADIAYRKSLQLNSDDYSVVNNLSLLYRAMGKIKLADELSQLSSRHRNRNPYFHYAKARLAYSEKKYNEALALLDRALSLDAKEGNFLQLKAHVLRRLKQPEKAIAMLKQAVRMEPFEPEKALLNRLIEKWQNQDEL